jgi:hypothetical protein
MKFLKFLAAILFSFLLLTAAATQSPSPGIGKSKSLSAWASELVFLNQQQDAKNTPQIPFSHPIDADLAKIHQDEMLKLTEAAKLKFGQANSKQPEVRSKINEFYHQEILKQNDSVLSKLLSQPNHDKNLSFDHRLTAAKVLTQLKTHPTANLDATAGYDESGQIGFCFGRAMLAHYWLLKEGIQQNDLAKIFLFGELMVNRQLWRFHVAVILRDKKDGFIVVDPLFEQVLPLQEWLQKTSDFDIKGKFSRAKYYVTDPRKFLPSFGMYHQTQLEDPHLRKYFDDLARHLN